VLAHQVLQGEFSTVLGGLDLVDDGGDPQDVRVADVEAEAAHLTVGVCDVAGELAEPVLVGDPHALQVVEDIGDERKECGVGFDGVADQGKNPPGVEQLLGVVHCLDPRGSLRPGRRMLYGRRFRVGRPGGLPLGGGAGMGAAWLVAAEGGV
jgi:hypothetical protein